MIFGENHFEVEEKVEAIKDTLRYIEEDNIDILLVHNYKAKHSIQSDIYNSMW